MKKSEHRDHFLRPFKVVLDNVFGKAPLHVCIESAHPLTLGRPSHPLMRIIEKECFYEKGRSSPDNIETHFVSDRLSIPKLDGHILAIGGPRSNVISRIAMEYEATLGAKSQHYARHTTHTFKMDYAHIDREDYGGRLHADMDSLDKDAREIIYHYFGLLRKRPYEPDEKTLGEPVNLFSKNRHLRWKDNRTFPSLSARIAKSDPNETREVAAQRDFTIYDHFIETILPNVLSENWSRQALITYHGLRVLGTYTALLLLANKEFLAGVEKRLKYIKQFFLEEGEYPSAVQTGWKVVRALGPRVGVKDNLTTKLKQYGYKDVELVLDDGPIVYREHTHQGVEASIEVEAVTLEAIKNFRKEIRDRNFIGQDSRDTHSLKIDEINEQQILDAMSLQRDQHFRRHNIYVLGCFENKKTVHTQQSRALTLVHALYKAGKIKPNTKIGIVGGGVSGMAAAIAAVETGARVVLMEAERKLAPIQDRCSHRSLNPFSYDWPRTGSDRKKTNFPIDALNWTADPTAQKVFRQLSNNFTAFEKKANLKGDRQSLTFYPNFEVQGYYFDRVNRKHYLSKLPFPDQVQELWEQKNGDDCDDRAAVEERWRKKYAEHGSEIVRAAKVAGSLDDGQPDFADGMVDCDIVIFATGYGEEDAHGSLKRAGINIDEDLLISHSYWEDDSGRFSECSRNGTTFVVSGSGDGALVDILRLVIKQFKDEKWHAEFIKRLNDLTCSDMSGAIWSNRRDLLVFGHALLQLFESDEFKLIEGEEERIEQIEKTLAGFDIDAFLDAMSIELNDVVVQNVSIDPQPFWADSATAHRLLVWCLYKKGKVRFIRGSIVGMGDKKKTVVVKRRLMAKKRWFDVEGVIVRHGVGGQNGKFLNIQGLLYKYDKDPALIARDGQRLVSLLRLSNDLHPETEKFFRHTIRNLR
ncbi:hypothetical protein QWY75_00435 [Pontixanthobacter aestiaquae]|uniref:FAD dependent oxidoreductase n=1 Tax=Pontixanthobacter aestiaquae TaxID=1509367 RepID=A0A844ZBD1_9SPHN|nr:hypothetical protein [Pontixanthobacter aestiaquae]MDN3644665.1 hypothetical protein [Pontixanthobacter aestiaquae]MXO84327.1 hypothetical protein [Pontixanthobacter aestiaquae]